jgi:hypothetical protein
VAWLDPVAMGTTSSLLYEKKLERTDANPIKDRILDSHQRVAIKLIGSHTAFMLVHLMDERSRY